MFDLDGDWLFASYLLRLSLRPDRALPGFVSAFMNSPAGRLQVLCASRPSINMANINTSEIASMVVPVPSVDVQRRLLRPLVAAQSNRIATIAKGQGLLSETNHTLAVELGVGVTVEPFSRTYGVQARSLRRADRLAVQCFHPERANILAAIATSDVPSWPLAAAAEFVRDVVTPHPGEDYVGLSAVASHTGELVSVGEEASSAFRYETGDVLLCRLCPHLNKVYLAGGGGLCSTEFYVLRARAGVRSDYLAVLLRSQLVTAQTRHLMTGNTHPRVAPSDAASILLPVPNVAVQRAIATEFAKRKREADGLRLAADTRWRKAQRRFDEALLGT